MRIKEVKGSAIENVDFNNLDFGKTFTDYMLVSDFDGESWSEYSIEPLDNLSLHPATAVLHYGQAIFEGLKAYKNEYNEVNIFRLKDNIKRLNRSADRMCIAQVNEEDALAGIKKFVELQKDWVPNKEQGSLYVRPFIISTDDTLRAQLSTGYRFIVIACPVGFYYSVPLNIFVEQNYRRAAKGGVGYAKAAGNYAASFYPTNAAKKNGFDQILWTDINNDYALEELGSANFFFVKDNVLFTPELHDSILEGITRDTVIQLAIQSGMEVQESKITVSDLEGFLKAGSVQCLFATGTAAAVTYINSITIGENAYTVESNSFDPILNIKVTLDNSKFLVDRSNSQWNVVVD